MKGVKLPCSSSCTEVASSISAQLIGVTTSFDSNVASCRWICPTLSGSPTCSTLFLLAGAVLGRDIPEHAERDRSTYRWLRALSTLLLPEDRILDADLRRMRATASAIGKYRKTVSGKSLIYHFRSCFMFFPHDPNSKSDWCYTHSTTNQWELDNVHVRVKKRGETKVIKSRVVFVLNLIGGEGGVNLVSWFCFTTLSGWL